MIVKIPKVDTVRPGLMFTGAKLQALTIDEADTYLTEFEINQIAINTYGAITNGDFLCI